MASLFKKIAGYVHPALNVISPNKGKDSSAAWTDYGNYQARQAELDAAMKEYENVPTTLRAKYLDAAKKAGTYGATDEFNSGLESEVVAGSRGARVGLANRINALKKAMGQEDTFDPEGLGQTQANMTQDQLRNAPLQEDSTQVSAVAEPREGSGNFKASPSNAPAALQAGRRTGSGNWKGTAKTQNRGAALNRAISNERQPGVPGKLAPDIKKNPRNVKQY